MKYINSFNKSNTSNHFSILDSHIKDLLPKRMSIYTQGGGGDGGGSFELKLSVVTREVDILRVTYSQNNMENCDGDVTADGEPDNLEFDIHFYDNDSGLKINVDVTYGDAVISSFSIEKPDKVTVIHYTGFGSHIDPETHYGLSDDSIKDLIKFFRGFGFKLKSKDFAFLDKYPDSYVHENIKLTPLKSNNKILLVNNAKPQESRYFNNLRKYCQNRGIEYVTAISDLDIERQIKKNNIVGVILSGSDYRLSKPIDNQEGLGSRKALEILDCPILGICYGFQTMAKHHGSDVKPSGKLNLDSMIVTDYEKNHSLFKGITLENTPVSFAYNDIITECPEGFRIIARMGDVIVGISNDKQKRYGLLFHPEDMHRTYIILDNFISMFDNTREEQEALKIGKFQIESFSGYIKKFKR